MKDVERRIKKLEDKLIPSRQIALLLIKSNSKHESWIKTGKSRYAINDQVNLNEFTKEKLKNANAATICLANSIADNFIAEKLFTKKDLIFALQISGIERF